MTRLPFRLCSAKLPVPVAARAVCLQVEERLEFYKTGKAPRKNADVMHDIILSMGEDISRKDHSGVLSIACLQGLCGWLVGSVLCACVFSRPEAREG